jgi:hypothetical protein
MTSKPIDLTVSVTSSQETTIPFGKYRGHTIEDILVIDPGYLEWLSAQDWFRTQHVHLHQIIINGAQSEETPEHNKLQVLFLDDDFCMQVISIGLDRHCRMIYRRDFELAGIDVVLEADCGVVGIEIKPSVGDDYPAVIRQIKAARARLANQLARQEPGITTQYIPYMAQRLENGISQILFLVSYTGIGATEKQFIATCGAAGIAVIFLKDVT